MTLNTIALEFVSPDVEHGPQRAVEEACKLLQLSRRFGIDGGIGQVMIHGLIEQDGDRPAERKLKYEVLELC